MSGAESEAWFDSLDGFFASRGIEIDVPNLPLFHEE